MANIYCDIAEIGGFTPYLTAGAGIARNRIKVINFFYYFLVVNFFSNLADWS